MKKITKVLLAVMLVLSIMVSAFAFTGVFANAQAMQKGVYLELSGTNRGNDWITVSGTAIQDTALTATLHNGEDGTDANRSIIPVSYSSSGSITLGGFNDEPLESGAMRKFTVAGNCNAEQVFSITITYYVEGNPEETKETCTAYIYASAKQSYTSVTGTSETDRKWYEVAQYEAKCNYKLSPVSSGSASQESISEKEGGKSRTGIAYDMDVKDARVTANLYYDGSRYTTWEDLGMNIYATGDTMRKNYNVDSVTLSQTSSTGSLSILKIDVNGETKSNSSTFNYDKDNPNSPYTEFAAGTETPLEMKGTLPTEDSSKYTIKLRTRGMTGGLVVDGLASAVSVYLEPEFTLNVYNVNKSNLRNKLVEICTVGLNQASYTESSWNTFASALSNAYTVLGTLNATKTQVTNALNSLNTAYNRLVRYAVVYTNQYYYYGVNNLNPVEINDVRTIDMYVPNGSQAEEYKPEVLKKGTYQVTLTDPSTGEQTTEDITFNRQNVVTSKQINVGEDTNYTEVINQYYWYVDTSALEAAIAEAQNASNKDEGNYNIYTESSWEDYQNAAAAGVPLVNNTTLFQNQINNATRAILEAKDNLIQEEVNTDWLDIGMAWASQIIASKEGDNYDNNFGYDWTYDTVFAKPYAAGLFANLENAYNAADDLINSPDVFTRYEAEQATKAIWDAIKELRTMDKRGIFIGSDRVRYADLDNYGRYIGLGDPDNLLVEGKGLRSVYNDIMNTTSGEYRLNKEEFTEDSWNELLFAIYGEFDPSDYEENFFTAENFKENEFYVEYDGCAETPEAYAVDDEIGELNVPAYSMINNIWFLASQADYNACTDNLIEKVNNLEWIVDASELEEKYAEAEGIDLELYTRASSERLEKDIAYVSGMLEKLAEPQLYGDKEAIRNYDIEAAVEELIEAIEALELKPALIPDDDIIINPMDSEEPLVAESANSLAQDVLNDFSVENDSANAIRKVYDTNNNPVDLDQPVGTGYTVVLQSVDGSEIFSSVTLVVKGDVVGDAKLDAADVNLVFSYSFTDEGIEDGSIYALAADVNGDGKVDLSDCIMIELLANR